MAPSVPQSLRHIPTKYGLVARLWKTAFYHLLETLRRAASSCPPEAEENAALEHLVVSVVSDNLIQATEPPFAELHLLRLHLLFRPARRAEPRPIQQ